MWRSSKAKPPEPELPIMQIRTEAGRGSRADVDYTSVRKREPSIRPWEENLERRESLVERMSSRISRMNRNTRMTAPRNSSMVRRFSSLLEKEPTPVMSDVASHHFQKQWNRQIQMRVFEAKDLPGGWNVDPYCQLEIGKLKLRTQTVWNSQEPKWEQDFGPFVPGEMVQDITVTCYDTDMLSADDYLCHCTIPLSAITAERTTRWFPMVIDKSRLSMLEQARMLAKKGQPNPKVPEILISCIDVTKTHQHHLNTLKAFESPKAKQAVLKQGPPLGTKRVTYYDSATKTYIFKEIPGDDIKAVGARLARGEAAGAAGAIATKDPVRQLTAAEKDNLFARLGGGNSLTLPEIGSPSAATPATMPAPIPAAPISAPPAPPAGGEDGVWSGRAPLSAHPVQEYHSAGPAVRPAVRPSLVAAGGVLASGSGMDTHSAQDYILRANPHPIYHAPPRQAGNRSQLPPTMARNQADFTNVATTRSV